MYTTELLDRINSFPRWHYEFDLDGYKTPIFDHGHINRHKQRRSYFFEPLVDLFGGSLAGKRVLDLGCNAGFWSLCAIEHGCEYLLGIDGRQMHIDQANLVFEVNEVDKRRFDFRCDNLFQIPSEDIGNFDIVLCLGLLYHVSKHVNLLEWISEINTDVLVIDTSLSIMPGSLLEIYKDSLDEPRHSCDYELVMWPTRRAIFDMAEQFGYRVGTLKPAFTDYSRAEDYETGARRAFICAKQTDLSHLSDRFEVEADKRGEHHHHPNGAVTQLQDEVKAANAREAELQGTIADRDAQIAELTGRLQYVRRSLSWRLTFPFRYIVRLFVGRS